ncbi:hypothetical protein N8T08_007296 [Aspergillus melleus]|uniref:Uncharacterized protein n=1 Tax=Aspergillus melleus TaxID=138277 RepID=A0ACC3AYI7_9EURO|nr:hypothetical protein N8T08_007296 [Aspergillus melleus]
MLGSAGSARSTTIWAGALIISLLLLGLTAPVAGLRSTAGSPCVDVCNRQSNSTTGSEIACLDDEFKNTAKGSNFQQCVECQLRSNYSDSASGQTDVEWGLYNLRYTFTSCVYGFPESVNNISSQCTVSCQPLDSSLEYDLRDPSGTNFDTWCDVSSFADNLISQCEFCYNLTTTQVYMANFLEALRYNCHFHVPTGSEFPINPTRIFSQSMLPESTVDLLNPDDGGSGINNLALVIALPILGFVILLCTLAVGCFFFIRWRRRKARKERASGHLHARWNDTTISTPAHGWVQYQQYQDMYSPAIQQQGYGAVQGAGAGGGFGFVDSDGRPQHNVGFSKSHYASVSESSVQAPSTTYSPEREKGSEQQTYWGGQVQPYFPPPGEVQGQQDQKK